MRGHETWRGDAHLRWSSNSIELSRWRGSWRCVRWHAGGQFFEGRELRWETRWVARNRA